jgi:hypothetical protein
MGEKRLHGGPGTCWSDITSYMACRVHYNEAKNVWRYYPDSPVFPGIREVWSLLKGTILRWKPRNSLTPEYLILIGHSHTEGVFVCVGEWVVVNSFLFQFLLGTLFQIMQGSNASWKSLISGLLNVAILKINHDLLSEEEIFSIHWICPVYIQVSWYMCPCASLAC